MFFDAAFRFVRAMALSVERGESEKKKRSEEEGGRLNVKIKWVVGCERGAGEVGKQRTTDDEQTSGSLF